MSTAPAHTPTRDLTQGPIVSTLLVFSLPILAGNVLQSLNGSVNAMWVGKYLGEAALTATANANNIMFLLIGLILAWAWLPPFWWPKAWGQKILRKRAL